MIFEWDESKNQTNIEKHGISFEEASLIFQGPILSRKDERFDYIEERVISIGELIDSIVFVVVHTTEEEQDKDYLCTKSKFERKDVVL